MYFEINMRKSNGKPLFYALLNPYRQGREVVFLPPDGAGQVGVIKWKYNLCSGYH